MQTRGRNISYQAAQIKAAKGEHAHGDVREPEGWTHKFHERSYHNQRQERHHEREHKEQKGHKLKQHHLRDFLVGAVSPVIQNN